MMRFHFRIVLDMNKNLIIINRLNNISIIMIHLLFKMKDKCNSKPSNLKRIISSPQKMSIYWI